MGVCYARCPLANLRHSTAPPEELPTGSPPKLLQASSPPNPTSAHPLPSTGRLVLAGVCSDKRASRHPSSQNTTSSSVLGCSYGIFSNMYCALISVLSHAGCVRQTSTPHLMTPCFQHHRLRGDELCRSLSGMRSKKRASSSEPLSFNNFVA